MKEKSGGDKLLNSFMTLILESRVYDPNTGHIDFNNLLSKNISAFRNFCDYLAEYVKIFGNKRSFNKIIVPCTSAFPMGILPIVSVISYLRKIPVIIWKECANAVTCKSAFHGKLDKTDILLIVQDVTFGGTTAAKIICDLGFQKDWGRLETVLVIIDYENGARGTIEENAKSYLKSDVEFHSILSVADLEAFAAKSGNKVVNG